MPRPHPINRPAVRVLAAITALAAASAAAYLAGPGVVDLAAQRLASGAVAGHSYADHIGPLPAGALTRAAVAFPAAGWRLASAVGATQPGFRDTTIDLGAARAVSALLYHPAAQADAILEFAVRTSPDGRQWSLPVSHGRLPALGGEQSIELPVAPARYLKVTSRSRGADGTATLTANRLQLLGAAPDAPPAGTVVLPRTGWTAAASSEETARENGRASNVLDGNRDTIWHSKYGGVTPTLPQSITIDMKTARPVAALTYYARAGETPNGAIANYQVATSTDGVTFAPAGAGTWTSYGNVVGTHKVAIFDNVATARYVRLTSTSAANGQPYATAAEIEISGPADAGTAGRWGGLMHFETLPVASSMLPGNKLLVWAAYANDTFKANTYGYTQTEVYDLTTDTTARATVSQTNHDMFCPGTAILADGRIMVTGGSSATKTSIFDPDTGAWTAGPAIKIARGYQAMTPLATGDVFMLGGSWGSADNGIDKGGEVWKASTNTWNRLTGITGAATKTADAKGLFRADNHMWLFAASNGKVFHAGPSRTMHWLNLTGSGSVTSAGLRGTNATDTMVGAAVMYDIDKVLTFGGGPNYDHSKASGRTFSINLAGGNAVVTEKGALNYPRSFVNPVVLPNGQVLALGGQGYTEPFSDMDSVLTPELWDPTTGQWTRLASAAVARNYHSVANLLPDGTVFSGGGGLCGTGCVTNHFNGQILTPPYLLNPDGSPKARPTVDSAPASSANASTITVGTSGDVQSFVLMRYGVSTHSVDNDQRRVPVTATTTGGGSYSVKIPANTIAIPGRYLLFALGGNGAPSLAKSIVITG